jgi:topoisomerase IA-like protein
MIRKSKQEWEVGATVKVGFLSGLIVIAKVPTPGDYAPDAYLLSRGDKWYSFVPHNGLSGISTDEAREMVAEAKRQSGKAEANAAQVAAAHINAAKLRAELMA